MGSSFYRSATALMVLTFLSHSAVANTVYAHHQGLPVVDLGYELHRASYFNDTGGFYNFSNIRYAAPPTGENRFRAPKTPKSNRGQVQTGSPDRICPQATPAWLAISAQFLTLYLEGQTEFNKSSFNISSGSGAATMDPRTTEDCLFLDVVVPQAIFEEAGNSKGAPVLVWIYGGGYTTGSKSSWGNPAGLIKRSQSGGAKGVIYVSMNYRLGAFGWLSGPTFQQDGTANAGLLDQRMALEWVQQHIHLFGGDPEQVSIFGESAGGGSVMHQITAHGGRHRAPFKQALAQSPGFFPVVSNLQQERTFNDFLAYANVTSVEDARKLPSSSLLEANLQQVGASPYGQYTYGPTVDGDFVPALPGLLLSRGEFAKDLNIMVGHNADEGLLFTSPFVQDNAAFGAQVQSFLPTTRAWPSVLNYITNTLYPSSAFPNQIARTAKFLSEMAFTCNTYYLNKAFDNCTYAYYFTVSPALHGLDIPYTYFNGPNPSVLSEDVAIALQEYITRWAETGNPNEAGVPFFPLYGDNSTVQNLNITGISQVRDPTANWRCDWWQKALYQ